MFSIQTTFAKSDAAEFSEKIMLCHQRDDEDVKTRNYVTSLKKSVASVFQNSAQNSFEQWKSRLTNVRKSKNKLNI